MPSSWESSVTFGGAPNPLQRRIGAWVVDRFGEECLLDRRERVARLVEEVVELAQAEELDEATAHLIVSRAYSRQRGEVEQEAGGVMVCVLAWAIAAGCDLDRALAREVLRIEAVPAELSRAKHAAKARAGTAPNPGKVEES